jgi:hypothetical protein
LTFLGVQTLAGTDNWTPTAGSTLDYIIVMGPGGDGGAATGAGSSAAGGGGGSGARIEGWVGDGVAAITGGAFVQVAGSNTELAIAGLALVAQQGADGGSSAATPIVQGGGGGFFSGLGASELVGSQGAPGQVGLLVLNEAATEISAVGGYGGGAGGVGAIIIGPGPQTLNGGSPAQGIGGGGGGGAIVNDTGTATGGIGAAGTIRIYEFGTPP